MDPTNGPALRNATLAAGFILLALALFLYVPGVLFTGPDGLHFIRQTDSLAFVQRFGHPSWNFFAPAVHDLRQCPDDGATAAEFPLLYYFTALVRAWTGAPGYLMRMVHLAFVVAGHVLLARTATRTLSSAVAGIAFSAWMFSSSVVIYYGANYLPDAAMYGCVLIGACLAVEHYRERDRCFHPTAILFLAFAGLLKAPATLYLLAYMILGLWYTWRRAAWRNARRGPLLGAASLLLIAAWHAYAIRYNAQHGTHYFMTWYEPLWVMPHAELLGTWGYVRDYWWTKYHHPTTWHVLLVLCALLLVRIRRIDGPARLTLGLLLLACMAFALLFFRKLRDHDYYFLTVAPTVCGIALAGLYALKSFTPARWMTITIALAALVLAVTGLDLGRLNLQRRLRPGADHFTHARVLGDAMPATLVALHVPQKARFIVSGDPSPNGALTLLDRDGWAYADTEAVPVDELIAKRADHLLILGNSTSVDTSRFHTIARTPDWRLMRLTHEEAGGTP